MPETTTPIASRHDFHAQLFEVVEAAARSGCAQMWWCDPDFAAWPLGERRMVEALAAWGVGRRRLTLVATRWDEITRRHARWLAWRRTWSHGVECRAPWETSVDLPVLLLAADRAVVRLDNPLRHRGRAATGPLALARARHEIDAVLQRSSVAFPVTTVGL